MSLVYIYMQVSFEKGGMAVPKHACACPAPPCAHPRPGNFTNRLNSLVPSKNSFASQTGPDAGQAPWITLKLIFFLLLQYNIDARA